MIFMILTLAVAGKVLAQTAKEYPLSKFALVSTIDASKGIELGEDISKAIEAFGQPSKEEKYDFKTDRVMGKLYTFLGNKLYVIDGKLVSYEIGNKLIAIGEKNGSTFKVGETITTTTNLTFHGFPVEIKAKTRVLNNLNYDYTSVVVLAHGTVLVDDHLSLYFDSNKELIYVHIGTDG